jgi:hypothetical protein
MHVDSHWRDASGNYLVLHVAGRDPGRLGGGSQRYPALIRSRISATRPAADDVGDVFKVVGQQFRRVTLREGERLWLKRDVSARDLVIRQSQPSAATQAALRPRGRRIARGVAG